MSDAEAFGRALAALVAFAHEAGVDVEGGWEVRPADGGPNWDVEVTRLADRR